MQLKSNLPDTAENRLKETLFIVGATSFEQFSLWERYGKNSQYTTLDRHSKPVYEKYNWEQISDGWGVQVGELDNRPVMLSVSWAKIEGQLIMFYYGMSQVVDHVMIDKWLEENFTGKWDNGRRRADIDAMNFKHCLDAIEEANKK